MYSRQDVEGRPKIALAALHDADQLDDASASRSDVVKLEHAITLPESFVWTDVANAHSQDMLPTESHLNGVIHDSRTAASIIIFALVYVVMALGKLPLYRIDRAGAALLGASLMIGAGVMTPDEAYHAVDFATVALLLGTMIVVANLRVAGFFNLASAWISARVHRPVTLLVAVVLLSGGLSAFLVNDTICLVMTPLVLELVMAQRRNPIPYLLGVAMAANVGSLATLTGNPQNMIVGSASGIPYATFTGCLAPVALVGLLFLIGLIVLAYRTELLTHDDLPIAPPIAHHHHGPLLRKTLAVLFSLIVLFFLGFEPAIVAITGGSVLLLTRRIKPQRIYVEIDWPMLVMFVGLFIVVGGLEKTLLSPQRVAEIVGFHLSNIWVLSLATALLSNVVSNVPAVLVLKPFLADLGQPQKAWLVVAMASTLAGNFTLVGSVANLIVAQRAKAYAVRLSFWEYLVVGAPLTVLTIALGAAWIGMVG